MKKVLFLFISFLAFLSCNMNVKEETAAQVQDKATAKDHVEVLYFQEKFDTQIGIC